MELLLTPENIKDTVVKNKNDSLIKTIKYVRHYNVSNNKLPNLNAEEFVYLKTILSDYKTYFSNLESIIIDEKTIFRRQEIANIYYDLITDFQIKLLKLYDDHSLIVKRNNEVKLYKNCADLFENCLPPNVTKIYVDIGYQFQIGSEIISKCDIPLRYNNLPVNLKSINLVLDYGYAQGQYDRISVNILHLLTFKMPINFYNF